MPTKIVHLVCLLTISFQFLIPSDTRSTNLGVQILQQDETPEQVSKSLSSSKTHVRSVPRSKDIDLFPSADFPFPSTSTTSTPTSPTPLPLSLLLPPLKTPLYPVHCFNHYSTRLGPALAEDCRLLITHVILAYPSPQTPIFFGYSDAADFDLRLRANEKWHHGSCVIFVRNTDKSRMDRFSMADVAIAAERIVVQCVAGAKYSVGGMSDVGNGAGSFFVGLGGRPRVDRWRRGEMSG